MPADPVNGLIANEGVAGGRGGDGWIGVEVLRRAARELPSSEDLYPARAVPTLTTLNLEEPLQELTVDNEIQLVSDGEGLAVLGDPADVERFLVSEGLLLSSSKDLGLQGLGPVLSTGAGVAQAGSEIAANSGR
jgi:hypothetical protein